MGDTEPEPDIFSNQTRLPVMGLEHQPRHRTFVLPARCAVLMAALNLWEHWTFDEACAESVNCSCKDDHFHTNPLDL